MTPSPLVTSVGSAVTAVVASMVVNGSQVTAYDYEPGHEGMTLPAGTVAFLSLTRPLLGDGESILGTDDWDASWRVRLYLDLDSAQTAERVTREMAADVVLAFDSDRSLGGLVLDSVIRSVDAFVPLTDRDRPIAVVECEIDTRRLVNDLYH